MIDTTTAARWMTANKGLEIDVETEDGAVVIRGTAISLNSKGINVRVDDKVKSISLAKVTGLVCTTAQPEFIGLYDLTADDIADGIAEIEADDAWMDEDTEADYIADMVESGEVDLADIGTSATYTTRQVAEMVNMAAKDLRVQLRAWGMGVGQGKAYAFTDADVTDIKARLAATVE